MLSTHPALSLPLPGLSEEDLGDWIDTDFGAVKLQEVGGTTIVYRETSGAGTFAHSIDDGVVDAPKGSLPVSKGVAALKADVDLLSVVSKNQTCRDRRAVA